MLLTVLILGLLAALTVTFIYLYYRKLLREAKNYERGLKMVTLLIHLPPSSEDIEVGGRDARDVAEETISKAQVLYNILASTAQEGFKSRFYGQRHIGLEVVAKKGLVRFYAAVPVAMSEVVQQAVVSAYPSAQVEEVAEHNIFSPVGRISGTIGGELELKQHFAEPIATFQETKRDALQSMLNAFANLSAEDGAAIQVLLRPAHKNWTKQALTIASDKRDQKKKSGGAAAAGSMLKDLGTALWKPPEGSVDKSKPPEPPKPLSALEQAHIESIEDKTRHPAFETLIRVIASSNTASRSQAILNNLVASFALFDAPGKNGFKFSPARDIENFVTAFIFRFFPPELNKTVLNSVELATLFHLPDLGASPISSVQRQNSKQVDGPNQASEQGTLLGFNVYRGVKKEIRLSDEDRRRHLYVVGQTGTGKSVLMENLALQDMFDGRGFAFIDPHGDAVERLLNLVPHERAEDVIYFSPAEMDYPLGLNLFEFQNPEQKDFLIQEAINMLYKLYDPQHTGIIGPRYEHWFRNAALTLMSDPGGSTFIDIPKLFTDNRYSKQKLKHVTDPMVREFWEGEMAKTSDYHKSEILGWFVSKFGAFQSNEMMRNIIGQTKSSFDLRKIMDDGKILLVNLSKGQTGELNSKLLGMIFVMKFQAAAMSRAALPEEQRRDYSVYVDEFQNFSTDSFATILSEARKYRLSLVVANQFITQLSEEVRDAVFGNVGSIVGLRVGANDADFLTKQFAPVFDTEDLVKLPNYNAVVRLMIGGVPSQPFSMATMPPLGHPNTNLGTALKRLSAAKYARPRAVVEKEIFDRLKTIVPEPPSFGGFGSSPFGPPSRPANASPGQASSSFLDEWLAKRRAQAVATPGGLPPADDSLDDEPSELSPSTSDRPVMDHRPLKLQPLSTPVPIAAPQPPPKKPTVVDANKPKPTPAQPIEDELVKAPPPVTIKPTKPVAPVISIKPKPTIPTGPVPTEFAKAKASGDIKFEESPIDGSIKDKDNISGLADIVRRQIDLQPEVEPLKVAKPAAKAKEEEAAKPEEILIDEEGNIKFTK